MTDYRITATVPLDKLGPVVTKLAELGIEPPDIARITGAEPEQPKRRASRAKPVSETKSGEAILRSMRITNTAPDRVWELTELGTFLAAAGLSASSASSVAAGLIEEGILARVAAGKFRIAQAVNPNGPGAAATHHVA